MRRYLATLAATTYLAAPPIHAIDTDGQFLARGAGINSCQAYTEAVQAKDGSGSVYFGWITGFLSGYNFGASETFDALPFPDIQTIAGMVYRSCLDKPEQTVSDSLTTLLLSFSRFRIASASPLLTASHDGNSVTIRQSVLLWVQQQLLSKGLYEGMADGKFGPGTRAALSTYQTSKGLEPDGLPGPSTLLRLIQDTAIKAE